LYEVIPLKLFLDVVPSLVDNRVDVFVEDGNVSTLAKSASQDWLFDPLGFPKPRVI